MRQALCACVLLLACITPVLAEPALLTARIEYVRGTDYFPAPVCADMPEDCIPWSYWLIYRATVEEVLQGNFEQQAFDFAVLQHAQYNPRVLRERLFTLMIRDFTNPETVMQLGVNRFATDLRTFEEIVCLDSEPNSDGCYDLGELRVGKNRQEATD